MRSQLLKFSTYGLSIISSSSRATASTYLNELGSDDRWIEKQLSHSDNDKTRSTYNHAKWLRNRRSMLQWYADFLDGKAEMPVHDDGLDKIKY
ncbi:hypothetical protein [Acinetobacter seifertii]|uniref:hypothetical protein n=1 Tax=Acinetobacter seifertii TaxID=1530123 RepID=UPI001D172345|nr:hypothetical protein [Acinetobacter seifertii]